MAILTLVVAYLFGSIPFGHIIVKVATGRDVRESGSGATGATNVMRTAGKSAGYMTFALDIMKGVAAVFVARTLSGVGIMETPWIVAAAAFAAIVGHVFPVWLGFRAGKGVATGLGVFLVIAPLAALTSFVIFILVVVLTKYVSLGSIIGSLSMIPLIYLYNGLIWPSEYLLQMEAGVAAVAGLIVFKHLENIKRLMAGTESKFGSKAKAV